MLSPLPNQYEQRHLDGYYHTASNDLYHLSGDYFVAQSGKSLFVCVTSTSTDNVRLMDIIRVKPVTV